MTARPSLSAMGWQLAKDANRTLGGGMASIELMRRSFATTRLARRVASTRCWSRCRGSRPGTNVLAYCAGLGWLAHGAAGVAVALAVGVASGRRSSSR